MFPLIQPGKVALPQSEHVASTQGRLLSVVCVCALRYIAPGAAYVNVHTVANPDGEIRAQINKMAMVTSA